MWYLHRTLLFIWKRNIAFIKFLCLCIVLFEKFATLIWFLRLSNITLFLIVTLFFSLPWQVKLWCDCPFWPDDGMCKLRDCSVCECPESEFPEPFKKPFQALPADDLKCQEGKPEATVDRTLDSKAFRGWIEVDNPWTYDDETDNGRVFML